MDKKVFNGSSIKFIADPYLLCLGVSVWLINTAVSGTLSVLLYIGYIPTYTDDRIGSSILFLVLCILMNLICLCALPKWLVTIRVSKNGITVKPVFKKSTDKKFSDYGYIYYASYRHFGFKLKYAVFSQIKLSDYQLAHINQVPISEKVIKFRIHRGNTDKLKMLLPKEYIKQLKKQGWQ